MADLVTTSLSMVRGDSASFDIALLLKGKPISVPQNALFWFTAKRGIDDLDVAAVFSKQVGRGIVTVDSQNGLLRVDLAPADTSGLPATQTLLVWDLQMKDQAGHVYTLAMGILSVTPDVTVETS